MSRQPQSQSGGGGWIVAVVVIIIIVVAVVAYGGEPSHDDCTRIANEQGTQAALDKNCWGLRGAEYTHDR